LEPVSGPETCDRCFTLRNNYSPEKFFVVVVFFVFLFFCKLTIFGKSTYIMKALGGLTI
jgi:small neutral amino acid transporter SnatA (MarC family)